MDYQDFDSWDTTQAQKVLVRVGVLVELMEPVDKGDRWYLLIPSTGETFHNWKDIANYLTKPREALG